MKLPFILLLSFLCVFSNAQTHKRNFHQREVGLFGGGSYYIGDLNTRKHFVYTRPAAGAFFRYALNYRIAFRFGFNYGSVSASDKLSKEADQLERNLSFRSNIYEGQAITEFNFVEYRIGNNKHYFTMFTFAGIGGYHFNPKTDFGSGFVASAPLKVEGQNYKTLQMNIPFGVGLKWNISDLVGLGFEWGPRKLFTDYLDDVSGVFPLTGAMRGNPRSKDWYFFYGFTLNVRLPKPNRECHGMGLGG